jgi:mRNA-degrading endonuclease RelE of RelBE toxin-antitoxin system
MPIIRLSSRFVKSYARLPEHIRVKVDRQLKSLANDPRHPSLQTKPIRGIKGIFEARVDQSYRMTYERLEGDTYLMRVVGKHDETLRKP